MAGITFTCVYRLFKNSELDYIGSTFDLHARKNAHKTNCYNPNHKMYGYKVYEIIRNNGGLDEFQFEVLEYYNESISKKELKQEEQKYIDMFEPTLNGCNAYGNKISNKERCKKYHAENREQCLERKKKFYFENKAKIVAKAVEKIICECGSITSYSHKARHEKSKLHLKKMKLKNDC